MSIMNHSAELTKLLDRPLSLFVVATGAGAGIQKDIWEVPGCSSFLTGSSFPYAANDSSEFAGLTPGQFASEAFAHDLAAAAYKKAIDLEHPEREPVGLALTASVSGLKVHRGDHRVHVVCMTRDRIIGSTLRLVKGGVTPEDRKLDGSLADNHGIEALIAALNPEHPLNAPFQNVEAEARARFFEHPLFKGSVRLREASLDAQVPLFPGAFDPPHAGHLAIADKIKLGSIDSGFRAIDPIEPAFTICANPPHKDAITVQEMLRRAKTLQDRTVLFTENDPLYLDKARRRPGRVWVIGADALVRMLDPKWGVEPEKLVKEFYDLETTFIVFGREVDGKFIDAVEAINMLPPNPFHRTRYRPMSGRWDVSSTALRHPADQGGGHTRSGGSDPTGSTSAGPAAPSPG